jgi:hypothetical protein
LPAYDWEVMRRNRVAPVCSAVVTGQVRGLLPGLRVPGYLLGPVVGIAAMLVLLPFLAGLLPIVHFVRERIDIAVYPEEVRVEGLYVYRNPWPFPVVQGFSVPLPVDATHPMPIYLTVTRLAPDALPIPVRNILGRDSFELRFRAYEEVRVVVRYRQLAPSRDARYLLLTTRPWRRPLEHAVYTLTPHGVDLAGSNYGLQSDTRGVLAFERTNFMPPDDWRFWWEVRPR